MKKTPGDITILHKCTINNNHIVYHSWDIERNRQNLSFWTIFCPFTPLTTWKINILKNWKKTPEDIITLHKCTKNHDHMLYCSSDMVCNGRHFYFLHWAIFCHFTSLTAEKSKLKKKWKKRLEISSFYNSVPKLMIICYTVPEMWHLTDVIIFYFELFFALLPS